jgi:LPS O-antigen subunit length determinant protein (WzzB/FepE family)
MFDLRDIVRELGREPSPEEKRIRDLETSIWRTKMAVAALSAALLASLLALALGVKV